MNMEKRVEEKICCNLLVWAHGNCKNARHAQKKINSIGLFGTFSSSLVFYCLYFSIIWGFEMNYSIEKKIDRSPVIRLITDREGLLQ